jgi:hypothetical protein
MLLGNIVTYITHETSGDMMAAMRANNGYINNGVKQYTKDEK